MTLPKQSAAELQALAKKLAATGNVKMAAHYYERALGVAPLSAEILYDLAATVHNLGDRDRAQGLYERAIALNPSESGVHNDLGILHREKGEFGRAFDMFRAAARRDPNNAVIASNLGGSFLERGLIVEARALYERAVELAPRNGQYLYQLAEVSPFIAADARLRHMLDLLEDEKTLPIDDRIGLHFALGKALADIREHSMAFSQFEKGNTLKRSRIDYDEEIAIKQMKEFAGAFTRPQFEEIRRHGVSDETPIFIVGMPRSGSTLVKQILASHLSVAGAGEVPYFANALFFAPEKMQSQQKHSRQFVHSMSREHVRDIANGYLANLKCRTPNALRIVDKNLTNFRFVGLIRAVFPNATIIHVTRNALDVCWSCYSKLFAEAQPFSYELGELGRYYRAYTKVMDRWREVLPRDALIEIQYEDLIENFEPTCRRLVALCGLPWDAKCLEFYRGEDLVRTSSAVQVRQPLFREGVGRSAPFRPYLTALIDALA